MNVFFLPLQPFQQASERHFDDMFTALGSADDAPVDCGAKTNCGPEDYPWETGDIAVNQAA